MSKKNCDSCGKENHERAKFCTSCGKSLGTGASPTGGIPLEASNPGAPKPTPMRAPKPILHNAPEAAKPAPNAPTMFAAEGLNVAPRAGAVATPAPFSALKESPQPSGPSTSSPANTPTMFASDAPLPQPPARTSGGIPSAQVKIAEKLVVRTPVPTKAPKPTPQPGYDPMAATPPMPAQSPRITPRNDPAAMTLPANDGVSGDPPAYMATLPAPDEMDANGDGAPTAYDPGPRGISPSLKATVPRAAPVNASPVAAPPVAAVPVATPAGAATPCPRCATPIPAGFIFCGRCGFDMRTYTPPVSQPDDVPTPESQKGPVPDLVLLTPDGQECNRFALAFGDATVGRGANADISCPENLFLSERHSTFSWDGQRLLLRDLDSFNGTFIKIKGEIQLQNGDYLCIGQQFLRFELCEIVPSPSQSSDGTFRHGAPLPDIGARLILVGMGGLDFDVFYLRYEETTVGRVNGDIIFSKDNFISRSHAKIISREGNFFLSDLGSSNGTFLQIRGETELGHSELLLMGDQLFRIELPR